MVVVCLGPVCIPLYGLLPVLILVLKPIWNALPLSIQQFLRKMWRTIEQTPSLLVLLMSFCVAVSVLACYWTIENKILFALATVGTFVSAGKYQLMFQCAQTFVYKCHYELTVHCLCHRTHQVIFCTANCPKFTSWPRQKASRKWKRCYKPM